MQYYKVKNKNKKQGFLGNSDSKESACNAGDLGSIHGSESSPGEQNGNQFQVSCLENPMDRGVWQAIVRGVAKSWTRLSNYTLTFFHHEYPSLALPHMVW